MSLSRRAILISLAGLPALGGSPASAGSGLPEGLDTDADGTVDLAEAKKAAETLFDKLDHDHDGTLDAKEFAQEIVEGRSDQSRSRQRWDADEGRIPRRG
jgi:EF hand